MAKVALRLGGALKFDSKALQFVDDLEANQYIHQTMRDPWKLSQVR